MTIVDRNIDDLIFAEYNPRQLTQEQHKHLTDSLKRFGMVDPVIVNQHKDRKDIIIGGHQRARIWKELGNTTIPTVEEKLELDKEKELNVRLNKNVGEWDFDELANNFEVDELKDWGFADEDLKFETPETEGNIEDDEIPEVKEAFVKKGDIWILGEHRVMCGDSTNEADVALLMDGQKADMVFTDPPYNVQINYNQHKDDLSNNEYIEFSKKWFKLSKSVCNQILFTPGFGRGKGMPNLQMWNKIQIPDWIIVWVKTNAMSRSSLGGFNNWEPILFYGKNKNKLPQDIFDHPITVQQDVSDKTGGKLHPTPKQVDLWVKAIDILTDKLDVVYDPFLGSGTTLIAAEKTNRKCYGMEIDPHYCDVIVTRWQEFTGKKAYKQELELA